MVNFKNLIIDYRTSNLEKETLKLLGYNLLLCPPCTDLYKAIDGHPDIQIHIISHKNLVVQKNISKNFLNELLKLDCKIHKTKKGLSNKYPQDIILNALNLGDLFLHKLNSTDDTLLELLKDKKLINTKQGYTKCSTAIVSKNAIMTSDKSIYTALKDTNIDILLIPEGNIELPHLNYGFIGGTCGLIEDDLLAFFGNLENYPHKDMIKYFLKNHKVDFISLGDGNLIDRGSILKL